MVSSVKSLPDHYQALGLPATANEQEIARAFARAMSMFGARSLRSAAQICAAFEVLRSPAKRREYDRSIGLVNERTPDSWRWRIATAQSNRGLMGSAWTDLAKQVAGDPPSPHHKLDLQSRLETGAEPKIASFIASSLREPPSVDVQEPKSESKPEERRATDHDSALEQHVAQLLAVRNAQHDSGFSDEVRTLEWKRPALLLGGLVLAAGIIGTFTGLWVQGGPDAAPPPKDTLTIPLPKADSEPVMAPAPVAKSPPAVAQRQPSIHTTLASTSRKIAVPQQQPTPVAQEAVSDEPPTAPSSEQVQAASDQLAATTPAPTTLETTLPLPRETVARTIAKIGYSCGTVASVAAIDGASPGVFKVTCSSGQSYQATPVDGRYRFRKMGGR